ncbi:MAG: hypothetical protein LBS04_07035 [Tannerellaceae bacterium]|jgi:hypothetical protein|nr:hypothetical protein [Tannerellaceae bacterium]
MEKDKPHISLGKSFPQLATRGGILRWLPHLQGEKKFTGKYCKTPFPAMKENAILRSGMAGGPSVKTIGDLSYQLIK